jgi:hypothetical protein
MKNFAQRMLARPAGCSIETRLDVPARNVEMSLDAADTSVRATSEVI